MKTYNRFLWGSAKDASTARAVAIVDNLNENLTEVKLTVYAGQETSSTAYWGNVNHQKKEEMVYEPNCGNRKKKGPAVITSFPIQLPSY